MKLREEIYLGSYKLLRRPAEPSTPQCLARSKAKFNFRDSVPTISSVPPSANLGCRRQICLERTPLNFALSHNCTLRRSDEAAELLGGIIFTYNRPPQSSSVSEIELSIGDQRISEELAFQKSLFTRSNCARRRAPELGKDPFD